MQQENDPEGRPQVRGVQRRLLRTLDMLLAISPQEAAARFLRAKVNKPRGLRLVGSGWRLWFGLRSLWLRFGSWDLGIRGWGLASVFWLIIHWLLFIDERGLGFGLGMRSEDLGFENWDLGLRKDLGLRTAVWAFERNWSLVFCH